MVGFTVTAGQVVDFDIDTPFNGPGGLGAYLRLFNAQGTQIAFNNDGMAPGEDTLGFDPYLRYTFATGGSYFLGTSNYNNLQYNAVTGDGDTAGGFNSIGTYQLIIQTASVAVPDPNDTILEAASLGTLSTTPITVSASISPDTDVNMVSFLVTSGQVVDFDIDSPFTFDNPIDKYQCNFDSRGEWVCHRDRIPFGCRSQSGFRCQLK